jgi:hypothetical protein
MGWRTKLKGGGEFDVFTGWRKVMSFRPGTIKWFKRKHNKRFRREWREKKW